MRCTINSGDILVVISYWLPWPKSQLSVSPGTPAPLGQVSGDIKHIYGNMQKLEECCHRCKGDDTKNDDDNNRSN